MLTTRIKSLGIALTALMVPAAWAAFPPAEWISPEGARWRTSYNFASAVAVTPNDDLHTIFFETEGNAAYYRRYDNAAGRWDPPERLDTGGGRDACILTDADSRIHVFFKTAGGALAHRIRRGGQWGPITEILLANRCLTFPSPYLLPTGDIALACVAENGGLPSQIAFTIWRRAAETWEPCTLVSDARGDLGAWMPTLAWYRDRLRLAYRDDTTGDMEIYERVFDNGKWLPIQRLTYDPNNSYHPRLFVDERERLHLVFMDNRSGRACLWEFLDEGNGWGSERIIYDGGGSAFHPNVGRARTGQPVLMWEDTSAGPYTQIFCFTTAANGGWTPAFRSSRAAAFHSCPSAVATAAGDIVLCYNEDESRVMIQKLPLTALNTGRVIFRAARVEHDYVLRWEGAGLAGIEAFNLYRRGPSDRNWKRLNAAPIAGDPPFRFRDSIDTTAPALYRLEGLDGGGAPRVLAECAVTGTAAPVRPFSIRAYPNPCSGACTFAWEQNDAGPVRISLFDIRGARVLTRTLPGHAGANKYTLAVEALPPGTYIAAAEALEETVRVKIIIAR